MRIIRIRIFADKFQAPLERAHDAIVIQHRQVAFASVHVAFEHVSKLLPRICADDADQKKILSASSAQIRGRVSSKRPQLSAPSVLLVRKRRCTAG